jgi:hypothetical protein
MDFADILPIRVDFHHWLHEGLMTCAKNTMYFAYRYVCLAETRAGLVTNGDHYCVRVLVSSMRGPRSMCEGWGDRPQDGPSRQHEPKPVNSKRAARRGWERIHLTAGS